MKFQLHTIFICLSLILFTASIQAKKALVIYPNLGQNAESMAKMANQISFRLSNDYKYESIFKQLDSMPQAGDKDGILAYGQGQEGIDELIYFDVNVLGNKCFYNISKYNLADKSTIFSDHFIVMSSEDYEILINRFSKLLGENIKWDQTRDIDNITQRDAVQRKKRNHGSFGFLLVSGVSKPMQESLSRYKSYYSYSYYSYNDYYKIVQPDQFLILSGGISYDVEKFFVDGNISLLGLSGLSFEIGGGYYFKDSFIAPYGGLNLGATWLFNTTIDSTLITTTDYDYSSGTYKDTSYYENEISDEVGLSVTGRLGVKMLRSQMFQPFVEAFFTGVAANRFEKFGGIKLGLVLTL